ncbi:endonuclease III [Rubritalea halochordaticola]|uniref:Adenine DNA glycosylase n=1 Tax=Rubritalea halochordaticola TaxID=714537 RepID=A0ABP9UWP6_9BACT
MPLQQPASFQKSLIQWFSKEGEDYPWRQTTDPWHILISEVMLQQTQVATVLNKGFFVRFIAQFPTPADLARADEQTILSAWEGLGYYRRVRNLQKAAKAICDYHEGIFPKQYEQIRALPGIGRYTAGAVASFAYNQSQPIVDANVARVFSRVFDYQERVDTTAGQKQLWSWAEQLVPAKNARAYNSALMELGQQVCTNKTPKCETCILKKFCSTKDPTSLPKKGSAKKTVLVDEHCILAIQDGKILLHQEKASARRSGMWKLPERAHHQLEACPLLSKSTYGITHHRVTLRIYDTRNISIPNSENPEQEKWHQLEELPTLPMPSPFRKVLDTLLADLF